MLIYGSELESLSHLIVDVKQHNSLPRAKIGGDDSPGCLMIQVSMNTPHHPMSDTIKSSPVCLICRYSSRGSCADWDFQHRAAAAATDLSWCIVWSQVVVLYQILNCNIKHWLDSYHNA